MKLFDYHLTAEESLMSFKDIIRLYFDITSHIGRKREIGCVNHSRHRLGTEIVIESPVIPDNPEPVLI